MRRMANASGAAVSDVTLTSAVGAILFHASAFFARERARPGSDAALAPARQRPTIPVAAFDSSEFSREERMAENELRPGFGPNVYIFAAVGAVLGGIMGAGVVGFPVAIGAVVIGALCGGILGFYMLKV
jgi:hypothetical protein